MNVPLQVSLLYNYTVKKPIVSGHQPPSSVLPVGSFSVKQMNDAVVDDWRWTNEKSNDLEVAHLPSGTSSTWFLVELEFGNVGFRREETTGVPGEKPLVAKEPNEEKLNPLRHEAGIWTQATLVGGDCSHHCATLVPCMMMMMMMIASEKALWEFTQRLWWWGGGEQNTYLPKLSQ